MDVHELFGPIERIKNPPFTDCVLAQTGQIRRRWFVAQVFYIRSNPLRLFKQPLRRRSLDCREVIDNRRLECETVPGHDSLPAKPELLCDILAGHSLSVGQ